MNAYRLSIVLLVVPIFYSGVTGQNTTGTLTCKFCNRALSLDGCTGSVKCSDQESCFMDEIITEQLTIVYTGGCRAKSVCNAGISGSPSVGRREMTRRESGDLVACSRCCDFKKHSGELDCNARLCGIKYLNTNTSRCYLCDSTATDSEQRDVEHPGDCLSETTCQPNEACSASRIRLGLKDTFRYSCMQKAMCSLLTQQALLRKEECITNFDPAICGNRKRQATEVCTACCGDGLCNSGTCEEVLDQLYKLWKGGALDFHTLKKTTTTQPPPTKPATPITTTAPPPPTRLPTDLPTSPPTTATTAIPTTTSTPPPTAAPIQPTTAATAPPPTISSTDQPTPPPTTTTIVTAALTVKTTVATDAPTITTTVASAAPIVTATVATDAPTITTNVASAAPTVTTTVATAAPTITTTVAPPAQTPIAAAVVVTQTSAAPSSPAMNSTPVTMVTTTDNITSIIF